AIAEAKSGCAMLQPGASGDDEEIVHAAVGRAVRVLHEARLAHRTVERDERRDLVLRPVQRRHRYLRIDRRARAADGRLEMAARALIEIESRTQTAGHVIDFLEDLARRRE